MGFGGPEVAPNVARPQAGASHLLDHPAVRKHGKGMTTEDFASFTEALADYSTVRVRGVGAAQYSGTEGQKFEQLTFEDTVLELVDELADVQNYAAMLAIKLLALSNGASA